MRDQIDIDEVLTRAIIREIGERLRTSFKEDELPAKLRVQLDRLNQLDEHRSPSTASETGQLTIQETTTACNELRSIRSARKWRALRRRARPGRLLWALERLGNKHGRARG
jgi:hypothetical protein